jgi:hypothetical protein
MLPLEKKSVEYWKYMGGCIQLISPSAQCELPHAGASRVNYNKIDTAGKEDGY